VRQWGNPSPKFTFIDPIVKADTAGVVYVTDGNFRITKFDAGGTVLATYGVVASSVGFGSAVNDMAFDPNATGDMYVALSSGIAQKYDKNGKRLFEFASGTYGVGIAVGPTYVYIVNSSAHDVEMYDKSTGVASGTFGAVQLSSPEAITIRNGTVYVTDSGAGKIQYFDLSGAFIAYWASSNAVGIATDANNNVYVSGGTNQVTVYNSINSVANTANTVTSWGGTGDTDGSFDGIRSITVTGSTVYVADNGPSGWNISNRGRIQKFSTAGAHQATWGGDDRAALGVVSTPEGIAYDSQGNSYVADVSNNRIQKFSPTGAFIKAWGSYGGAGPGDATGTFDMANPVFPAVDASDQVYVLDPGNNRVQVFDTDGNYLKQLDGTNSPDGFMYAPVSVAFGPGGDTYVAELSSERVQVFDSTGYHKRDIGSGGTANGEFSTPVGLAVDSAGNAYVSDLFANRIQKFNAAGAYVRKWDTEGAGSGQFEGPIGLAVDKADNFYVADVFNHRIQKFDSSGNYLLQLGGVGIGNGTFGWPIGVSVKPDGNVVVADYTMSLVQELAPAY
jgi:hypothetical protein